MIDLTKLRYWPKCACTDQLGTEDMEQRVLACTTGAALSAYHNKENMQLCASVDDYLSLSIITTMACGMSIDDDGDVDEVAFERVLSTLAADVRARRASIEEYNKQQKQKRGAVH